MLPTESPLASPPKSAIGSADDGDDLTTPSVEILRTDLVTTGGELGRSIPTFASRASSRTVVSGLSSPVSPHDMPSASIAAVRDDAADFLMSNDVVSNDVISLLIGAVEYNDTLDCQFFNDFPRTQHEIRPPFDAIQGHHCGQGTVFYLVKLGNRVMLQKKSILSRDETDVVQRLKREYAVGRRLFDLWDDEEAESCVLEYYGYSITGTGSELEFGILMEYCGDGDVSDWLKAVDRQVGDLEYSTSWMKRRYCALARMADALKYVHSNGIVHLDVKPKNFVVSDSVIKIVDLETSLPEVMTPVVDGFEGTHPYVRRLGMVDPSCDLAELDSFAQVDPYSQPSLKRDVYSFGVCAWDLFAGTATNREKFQTLISSGKEEEEEEEGEKPSRRFEFAFAETINLCLSNDRQLRPTMELVVDQLRELSGPLPRRSSNKISMDRLDRLHFKFARKSFTPIRPVNETIHSKANWTKTDGSVSIVFLKKQIHPREDDRIFVRRLLHLSHPNLCMCYGYYSGLMDMCPILVTVYEWCEWNAHEFVDLRIENGRWNDPKLKIRFLLDVARAICHLHEDFDDPIFHQDVKPANIMVQKLSPDDERCGIDDDHFVVKLADLSSARESSTLTLGSCVGTPGYHVPYTNAKMLGRLFDVFSFAVTCLEIWTGQRNVVAANELTLQIGERPMMEQYEDIPFQLRYMLRLCWGVSLAERPHFPDIVKTLTELCE